MASFIHRGRRRTRRFEYSQLLRDKMDFWFNNNSNINNEEEDLENEKTEENSLSDVISSRR